MTVALFLRVDGLIDPIYVPGSRAGGGRVMAKSVDDIAARLKEMITENGPDYLSNEPYEAYKKLLETKTADRKTAGAILCFLVSGMLEGTPEEDDPELYSRSIQKKCGFNKKVADRLAAIVLLLYSPDNKAQWKEMDRKGFSEFLREDFICTWKGHAVWDEGNGTVDCHYDAEIVLEPAEEAAYKNKEFEELLNKKPFIIKAEIHKFFERELCKHLDYEFRYYCECDDYYQPVVEDFELEYIIKEWCGKNGFTFINAEGDGDDDGYEPKFRSGWY